MTYPDPDTDPTSYVLVVAEKREQRAKAATSAPWISYYCGVEQGPGPDGVLPAISICYTGTDETGLAWPNAEHIAAEANPDHALKGVALWRRIAERHKPYDDYLPELCAACHERPDGCAGDWPCPDLLAVVAAAKAYVDGAS